MNTDNLGVKSFYKPSFHFIQKQKKEEEIAHQILKEGTKRNDNENGTMRTMTSDNGNDSNIQCRACLMKDGQMTNLFSVKVDDSFLFEMYKSTTMLSIDHNDNLPKHICKNCLVVLQQSHNFAKQCKKNHQKYSQLLLQDEKRSRNTQNLCTTCGKLFEKPLLLERHLKIHQKTSSKANLDCHNSEDNKDTLKYLCSSCGIRFQTNKQLYNHKIVHEMATKKISCPYCEKSFKRQFTLKEHIKIHDQKRPYLCQYCPKTFVQSSSWKTHLALHTGKKHACFICDNTFARPSLLKVHLRIHNNEEPFSCSICSKKFNLKGNLDDHLKSHSNERKFKCTICDLLFKKQATLKTHMYTHIGRPFVCRVCGAAFTMKSRLKTHLENHDAGSENTFEDNDETRIDEAILNEICCQIDSNQIMLENIDENAASFIYENAEIILFDERNNLIIDDNQQEIHFESEDFNEQPN